MYDGNSSEHGWGDRDGDLAVTLRDADGSLTGQPGSTVLRDYPVLTTARCYYRHSWNLAVCPHKYGKVGAGLSTRTERWVPASSLYLAQVRKGGCLFRAYT